MQVSIEEPYNLASMSAALPGDASTLDRVGKVVRAGGSLRQHDLLCQESSQ